MKNILFSVNYAVFINVSPVQAALGARSLVFSRSSRPLMRNAG